MQLHLDAAHLDQRRRAGAGGVGQGHALDRDGRRETPAHAHRPADGQLAAGSRLDALCYHALQVAAVDRAQPQPGDHGHGQDHEQKQGEQGAAAHGALQR